MIRQLLRALLHPRRTAAGLVRAWRHRVVKVSAGGKIYFRYKGGLFPDYLNHGDAAARIAPKALEYCSGKGIDVGAGAWPLQGAVAVQDGPDQNAYRLDGFADGSLDFVFSSHCLEHLDRWPEALALWARKLKPGGTMFLYLPHESMLLWRPGAPWVKDHHKWIPTDEAVSAMLSSLGLEVFDRSPGRDDFWSFYLAARKRGGAEC